MTSQPAPRVPWHRRPRVERGVVGGLLSLLAALFGFGAVWRLSEVDLAAGGAYLAGHLGGSLLCAGVVAWLVVRRWARQVRALGTWTLAVAAAAVLMTCGALLSSAVGFVPAAACTYDAGVTVRTSWTAYVAPTGRFRAGPGLNTGTYVVDGEEYDVQVGADQREQRQTAPAVAPTERNPFYTRTYRVPWVGSRWVCGTPSSTDQAALYGNAAAGPALLSAAVVLACAALRRTRALASERDSTASPGPV